MVDLDLQVVLTNPFVTSCAGSRHNMPPPSPPSVGAEASRADAT